MPNPLNTFLAEYATLVVSSSDATHDIYLLALIEVAANVKLRHAGLAQTIAIDLPLLIARFALHASCLCLLEPLLICLRPPRLIDFAHDICLLEFAATLLGAAALPHAQIIGNLIILCKYQYKREYRGIERGFAISSPLPQFACFHS